MKTFITQQQFEELLPFACSWAAEQEHFISKLGIPLNELQFADAIQIGVKKPELVRLLRVDQIPYPTHPILIEATRATNLISSNTAGMTFRYGILIRADVWENRRLVVHELVHTKQYERLGGFEGFLRPYLLECITPPGYPFGPLEQEAKRTENDEVFK